MEGDDAVEVTLCIASVFQSAKTTAKNDSKNERTSFEPAFPLAEMEALGSIRANVPPAALVSVRTIHPFVPLPIRRPLIRPRGARTELRTILQPVARSLFRIGRERRRLLGGKGIVV